MTAPRPSIADRLFAPVDIAPLVWLRIAFGAILLVEMGRYLGSPAIQAYFIQPHFHFKYAGFGWVEPLQAAGMYAVFGALAVLAALIAAGALYRVAMPLFFLGFTYVFLLERANYLNHFYLIALLSFVMIFLPANRALSVDARLRPSLRAGTVPAWTLWLARFQIALPYLFGGVAKLNADWLLRAEPMQTWLAARKSMAVVGPLLGEPWLPHAMSWAGCLFDLAIVPMLLARRTRPVALALAVAFHLTNATIFSIGIFPWFMLATLAIFFPPESLRPARWLRDTASAPLPGPRARRIIVAALAAWVAIHLVLPLRHYAYPGDVSWTEEGHEFSWHMLLRNKESEVTFFVHEGADGPVRRVRPEQSCLTLRQVQKMRDRPELLRQFAVHLAEEARQRGARDVRVTCRALVSLNRRRFRPLVDEGVDLGSMPWTLGPAAWVTERGD
jgi:vitamin K-dependent gamma-carboxylase